MKRRTLLKLLGALGLAPLTAGRLVANEPSAKGIFVLIDGIGAGLSVEQLRAFCEPLAEEAIPMGLGLYAGKEGPDHALAAFVAALLLERNDLFEAVLRTEGIFDLEPYFQIRAASQALARIASLYFGETERIPRIRTIADAFPGSTQSLNSLRAVGLRNAVKISERAKLAVSAPCNGDAVCLEGTVPLSLDNGAAELRTWLYDASDQGAHVIAVMSAEELGRREPGEIQAASTAIAEEIVSAVQSGRAFAVPFGEHLAWYDAFYPPVMTIFMDLPPENDVDTEASYARLREAFAAAGVPFSLVGPGDRLDAGAEGACLDLNAGPGAAKWFAKRSMLRHPTCVAGDPPQEMVTDLAGVGLDLVAETSRRGNPALDENGVLRWPVGRAADLSVVRGAHDLVVRLTARDYRDADRRDSILAALSEGKGGATPDERGLTGFVSTVMPADPVFAILRETRKDLGQSITDADETGIDSAALIGEARAAWQFIADNTEPATLLCPGTVHKTADGNYGYPALTMWDVGSLVRANLAAHELGFIPHDEFTTRAAALIDALPASPIGGAVLPNALISTTRKAALSSDFNVCDTGRLLSALYDLDRYPPSEGMAAPAVARWDLGSVLVDGHPHSVTAGQRVDDFLSHCTHYLSRAFSLWGMKVDTPYVVDTAGSVTDWQMRVLYSAAAIGAYGAEPLLLEETEFGLSSPSALLSDVLWAAQRRAWAVSGQLYCVSEAPLDRPPWFAYGGLDLGDADQRWVTRANTSDPAFATESFRNNALLVNTKGAFLWLAARPGKYSSALFEYVREKARSDDGTLSPGVYASTGAGMKGYADVNTQGVILDTVAYILRGRRPRAGRASTDTSERK